MTATLVAPQQAEHDPWRRADQAPRPAQSRRRRSASAVLTLRILGALTGLAVWVVLFSVGLSGLAEHRAQAQLYGDLRGELAPQNETAPVGGAIEPGRPVAVLAVPRLGIHDLVVVEGTRPQDLQNGPGHIRSSVLPGQAGTAVVLGRSLTFGAPFRNVPDLRTGDTITATTGQGIATYVVMDVRRAGDRVPVAGSGGRLVLATTEGGVLTPSRAVFVDATLTSPVDPAPPGRPNSIDADEGIQATDHQALFPLVLWLEGLLVVGVITPVVGARWRAPQTWLMAAPVLMAFLWGATVTASRLLPNLM